MNNNQPAASSNNSLITTALAVSFGGFIFGFDASVISGVIQFIGQDFRLSNWQIGFLVGVPTLGGIIAALTAAPLSDNIGRKKVLIIIASLYWVSALFSTFAPSYEALVLARFLGGLGFASLGIAPIYVTEISPKRLRGRLVSFNQLNIVVGFSAAYFCNFLLVRAINADVGWAQSLNIESNIWRWMLGIELLPATLYLLLLFRVPETPRWLMLKNRQAEAISVIQSLSSSPHSNEQHQGGAFEACEIDILEHDECSPLRERVQKLFSKRYRLVLMLGLLLGVAQQTTGINAIYFYAPSIFAEAGAGQNAAFAQAVWIGIINIIFTLIAMSLIDRIGRKPLLIIGLSGIITSMCLCSFAFNQASYSLSPADAKAVAAQHYELSDEEKLSDAEFEIDDSDAIILFNELLQLTKTTYTNDVAFNQAIVETLGLEKASELKQPLSQKAIQLNAMLVLVGILTFVASFAMSLGPVMWVLLPEIFPNELRGVGMAITGLANSLTSFFVQLTFLWAINYVGVAFTFGVYAALSVLALLAIYRYLPETRGKALEDMSEQFGYAR